jgi:hypothetical protein
MRKRSDEGKQAIARALLAAAGVAATVAVLMVAGGPAYAGQNANGSISVSPSVVPAGGTARITGSVEPQGCPTSDSAIPESTDALFPPDGFGPATARNSQGAFALDYTVPTSTPAGTYQIGLRCGGGSVGVTASLQVIADPIGGPATGAGGTAHEPSVLWTMSGAGCLLLAGIAVAVRRRLAGRVS